MNNPKVPNSKPSIIVLIDKPNWAYHRIGRFLIENLSNEYSFHLDFVRYYAKNKSKNPISRLKSLIELLKNRTAQNNKTYDIAIYLGFYFSDYFISDSRFKKPKWKYKKLIKGIYTDEFPPQSSKYEIKSKDDFAKLYLEDCDALICGSESIKSIYSSFFNETYYAGVTKNMNLWVQKEVMKNNNEKFIVGWSGDPSREFKGYFSHVVKAVELAKTKYPTIELKTRFSGPLKSLPKFYNDIDVVLIASDADAGPSLFAEACLCNVPSISTRIGFPNEVIINEVNGYFTEKNIIQMSDKIIELYENRDLLYEMSKRIRDDYLKGPGNIEKKKNVWRNLFENVLNKAK